MNKANSVSKKIRNKLYFGRFPLNLLIRRRSHLIVTGLPKTGTHYVDSLFSNFSRSEHEQDYFRMLRILYKSPSVSKMDAYLIDRDEKWHLEVDVSHLHELFLPRNVDLFPQAKFLYLFRDPVSWCISYANQKLKTRDTRKRASLIEFKLRFPTIDSYHVNDGPLEEKGLPGARQMMTYWEKNVSRALDLLPAERTLWLSTESLSSSTQELIDFFGVKPGDTEAFNITKHEGINVLRAEQFEPGYLQSLSDEICGTTLERIRSIEGV